MSWFKKNLSKIALALSIASSLVSCVNKEIKHFEQINEESKDNLKLSKIYILKEEEKISKRLFLQLKVSQNYELKGDELAKEGSFREAMINYQHSFKKNQQALDDLELLKIEFNKAKIDNQEEKNKIIDLERNLKERKTQIYLKYKKAKDQSTNQMSDVGSLSISDKGVDFIKGYEKFRAEAYQCEAGKWTIGFGHTDGVKFGDKTDITKATRIFKEDLKVYEAAVKKYVKVKLSQNQYDALVSLCFNIGETLFRKSDLVKDLNNGLYDKVPSRMKEWIKVRNPRTKELEKSNGLINRRNDEVDIWLYQRYNIKSKF
ncbi:lysozyme [Candidatus Woesearchaeota archaeon]|nr:lysozyme [Candidatus Woesearchaeota archaeon]